MAFYNWFERKHVHNIFVYVNIICGKSINSRMIKTFAFLFSLQIASKVRMDISSWSNKSSKLKRSIIRKIFLEKWHKTKKLNKDSALLVNNRVRAPWLQNVLIINSWPHWIKEGKEFRAVGIRYEGERIADITRIVT